ncbi:carbohydrate ABC transporter permease [Actinoplanes couchii]|uniref:Transporter integral membrane protein n=1 Tax=Actinoplanes couchii TaxID=403638 RepID=A0ABQ3X8H6_9ACTN|nr:sugar ABC transporter permease [Actinoplanes couchii]MDR6320175.1 ABC-type sugar transport system permease subunit [Actinoplanes couchii]GID54811.1 transporter integral membrane protein [Actinoplanes couchii]
MTTSTATRKSRVAWIAATPALLGLLAVFVYPVLDGVRISLSHWSGVGPLDWAGLDNYTALLDDADFRHSILITVAYSAGVSIGVVALACALAAPISRGVRGSGFYRVVWFLPSVVPTAAAGLFWSTAFQPGYGAVNSVLGFLGFGDQHAWLVTPETAIPVIIVVAIWANLGFAFLIVLGAMEQVPISVYEAAGIDGAGPIRQFFSMTLPNIRPVLILTLMLEAIWTANDFSVVWAMTNGGPGSSTATLPVLIYKEAFSFTDYGTAGAMAVLSGAVLLLLGLVGLRLSRGKEQ